MFQKIHSPRSLHPTQLLHQTDTPRRQVITYNSLDTNKIPNNTADTPLIDALTSHAHQVNAVPFHVPGHKRGSSAPVQLQKILDQPLQHDLTELPGLDYLSYPDGPILEAQRLAAKSFGAGQTWFLVNGTTVGIHAAVLSTCNGPKDALIVARNCHISGFNAMALAGCTPVWVQPQYHHGMAHHVTAESLEQAFEAALFQGLTPKAALVVSPTYYGVLSDIEALARVCHKYNAALIVDEAHGAHLCFLSQQQKQQRQPGHKKNTTSGNTLPRSALAAGADIVIQSTHKLLSSFTQTAMLHTSKNLDSTKRVDPARISRALQMLQTSSPSYLLMASLDAARAQMDSPGALEQPIKASEILYKFFHETAALEDPTYLPQLLPLENIKQRHRSSSAPDCTLPGPFRDPWRFTVLVSHLGITGWEASSILQQEFNIVAEMASDSAVVFALGVGSTEHHATQLLQALRLLSQKISLKSNKSERLIHVDDSIVAEKGKKKLPEMRMSPRDAFFAPSTEMVARQHAVGRVAAELLCPYPPGVPSVYPGEIIGSEIIEELVRVIEQGGKVLGASDPKLEAVRVIRVG